VVTYTTLLNKAHTLEKGRAIIADMRNDGITSNGYLQERFAEPLSLDELVALTGLNRFHLVRTFAKQVGMTPQAYQHQH
jgi:AraC-like DNA-binding protein